MTEAKGLISILLIVLFFLAGCPSAPGINKSKFKKAYAAAYEVKNSIAAGESYQQVAGRIKQLSAEISASKEEVATDEEKDLLDAYSDLLSTYSDGLVLWKHKLDFAFFNPVLKGRIYVGQDVEPIVLKYRFSTESHLYKPTGQYWKSIPGDSIGIIWSNADSQLKVIEGLMRY